MTSKTLGLIVVRVVFISGIQVFAQARRYARSAGQGPDARPTKPERLWSLLPEIWALMRPRRSTLAVAFLLMATGRLSGLVLPASTKVLIDDVIGARRGELLLPLVAVVLLATVLQGLSSFTLTQLVSKEAQKLIAEMRARVQQHVARLPVSFHDANRSGELVSRVMWDVEGLRNLVGTGLVEMAGGLLSAALAFAIMLYLSPRATVLTFVALAAFALVLLRALQVMRPIYREGNRLHAEVTGRLTETLGGIRVVKAYHAEPREAQVFAGGVRRILDNVMRSLTATSVMSLSSTVLLGVVGAAVMLVGAREILAGRMTIGAFFTYTVFLGFLVGPLFQVVAIGSQLTQALAGLERTREILGQRPEDEDERRTLALPALRGEVVFEEVGFAYRPGAPVLHGVSLRAAPGTVTALVGPSGAGKSTLISLVCAFHVPTSGRVLVDGIDLAGVRLDSYRSQLGVVFQDTFLFDGTIRENVAFSRPDASAEQVAEACRIAHVTEFAERLPEGQLTLVGERGVRLSGGQRQRVAIARAILADPRILILDEATSSLDSESEALIQEGLAWLMRGRTTFVIAHRLSTIRRAEQILVLEAGRVVESGSHQALMALGQRYREMYERQHGLQQNLFLAPGEEPRVPDAEPASPGPQDPTPSSIARDLLGQ